MATYLLVNLAFLIMIVGLFRVRIRKPTKVWVATLIVLLLLTAVFDTLIVGFGMVAYDPLKILGIKLGNAPIEDFFYAVLAAIIVPTLWQRSKK